MGNAITLAISYVVGFFVWVLGVASLTIVWFVTAPRPIDSIGAVTFIAMGGIGIASVGFIGLQDGPGVVSVAFVLVGLTIAIAAIRTGWHIRGRQQST